MDQGNAEKVETTGSVSTGEPAPEQPTAPEAAAPPPGEDLAARVAQLEQALAAADAQTKRYAADAENIRRRAVQEKEDLIKFAAERVVLNLLPVVDNFERAMQAAKHATDVTAVTQGLELISRQLQDVLTKSGVAPIEATGAPFDPNLHEAVQRVPAEDQPDNTVVEEFQRGYLLNGKVIRPAMVKVAVSG